MLLLCTMEEAFEAWHYKLRGDHTPRQECLGHVRRESLLVMLRCDVSIFSCFTPCKATAVTSLIELLASDNVVCAPVIDTP